MENLSTSTGPSLLAEDAIRQRSLNGGGLVPREADKDSEELALRSQNLLRDLLFTVNHADITGQHRAAACNLLSTLVEKCALSQIEQFRSLIWTNSTWESVFDVFLNQNHALNVKPLRQLLASLTSVLAKCQDKAVSESVKTQTLSKLAFYLTSPSENDPTRPTMQALAYFLSKKVVSVEQLSTYLRVEESATSKPHSQHRTLLEVVLRWAPFDDFASSAGALASTILQQTRSDSSELAFGGHKDSPWTPIVLETLSTKPESLVNFRHFVFPEIFQSDKVNFISFLEDLHIQEVLRGNGTITASSPLPRAQLEEVLFCALSVGSKLGLVRVAETQQQDTNASEIFFENNTLCIPDILLGNLLSRSSAKVRVAGLSMLIATTATTQPLSLGTIRALKNGLPLLHADSDAGFRSELFSLIKNLMDRIRAATSNLAKPTAKPKKSKSKSTTNIFLGPEESSKLLRAHKSFLEWYVSFLKMELRPTANYQRHISALKCICIIARSGVVSKVPQQFHSKSAGPVVAWPFNVEVLDNDTIDLLMNLLMDPFDVVRSTAAEILSLAGTKKSPDTHQPTETSELQLLVRVLNQAEEMMKLSGRADHADGVAHLYSILFIQCSDLVLNNAEWWTSRYGILEHLLNTLEETLRIAATDIVKAVSKHPLHGLFIGLRYIIERPDFYVSSSPDVTAVQRLRGILVRLHKSFHDVWSCVYETLCNDAPEGFVPEELEEEDIGTKDVLSYSWRALKESSLLLRAIVKSCPLVLQDQPLLSFDQLRALGDLSFTELAELRHRGAFSTVSQTFMVCCVRCNSGADTVSETLEDWYKRAILCIQNQTTINTRRSAGLPSLMIGIVVADGTGRLFQRAMKDLTLEATKPVDQDAEKVGGLSQVHALNCIKDIFKNSKLGERTEYHVPEALALAAKCLSSDTWAVRNSGLMLFRALMDRLIGTNDAYTDEDAPSHTRLSPTAISDLMIVILQLLSPAGDSGQLNTEVVFPALQLLQRAQPPRSMLQDIQKAVFRLTKSSQWHVRDKAARTFSTLTPIEERIQAAVQLLEETSDSQNATHGALLCSTYLVYRQQATIRAEEIHQLSAALYRQAGTLYHQNRCPFTQAAFVDIQTTIFHAACRKSCQLSTTDLAFVSAMEINNLLSLPASQSGAYSSLRESLAHAAIYEYAVFAGSSIDVEKTVEAFTDLARADPDACATALQQASKNCASQQRFAQSTADLLSKICVKLLFSLDISDIEVQAAAQDTVLSLLEAGQTHVVRNVFCRDLKTLYLPHSAETPLFQDKRIVLQGALIGFRLAGAEVPDRSLPDDLHEWVLQVRNAAKEENPFDTRFAAAQAVCQITDGLSSLVTLPDYTEAFLAYCLAVYDLDNDDDDEVRNVAAGTACKILGHVGRKNMTNDLVPQAANARLAQYIAARFRRSSILTAAAISKLTGDAITALDTRAVTQVLKSIDKQTTALFVQEKHNLFIDDTMEARIWSQVLMALDPDSSSASLTTILAKWTMEGLAVLSSEIQARPDTPLGWTRKPDVFVLGSQVICAAEVLLALCRTSKVSSVSATEVRGRLMDVLSKGKKNGANVLWLTQIEKVLERAILNGVGKVGSVVTAVYEEQVEA